MQNGDFKDTTCTSCLRKEKTHINDIFGCSHGRGGQQGGQYSQRKFFHDGSPGVGLDNLSICGNSAIVGVCMLIRQQLRSTKVCMRQMTKT